jgi:hypothetical protein
MGNYKQRMRHLINIICFAIFPLLGCAQEVDSLIFCDYPDEEAHPPFKIHELLNVLLDNRQNELPDCFDPSSTFYYNIIILNDGTVAEYNLECVINGQSCYISVDDVSKLEKWTPAKQNGKNCNQKMRFKTYIHFE